MKKVIHYINLSGLGGVQQLFYNYYSFARENSRFTHSAVGSVDIEKEFYDIDNYTNFKNSILSRFRLFKDIVSPSSAIHFHNVMGGRGISRLLSIMPAEKIIFHEHGTAWNLGREYSETYRKNAHISDSVIVNSDATGTMLTKKFGVSEDKISTVHNGLYRRDFMPEKVSKTGRKVGFIGRLEPHKGVDIFAETAVLSCDVEFIIAGDGPMKDYLTDEYSGIKNLSFVGRVNPDDFYKSVDMLVIPSVREPLGNIAVEAGFYNLPVIAANVDGLAEVITHGIHGILINNTDKIDYKIYEKFNCLPPEFVVNPITKNLEVPRRMSPAILAEAIKNALGNTGKMKELSEALNKRVKNNFCLENYSEKLEKIYCSMFNC